mgnify:CR=1 FL=1
MFMRCYALITYFTVIAKLFSIFSSTSDASNGLSLNRRLFLLNTEKSFVMHYTFLTFYLVFVVFAGTSCICMANLESVWLSHYRFGCDQGYV